MVKHLASGLYFINAGLGFLAVVWISWLLPLEDFAQIAFAITMGSFLSILVNFGQDQTQILSLLTLDKPKQRVLVFVRRHARSILILLAASSAFLSFETAKSAVISTAYASTLALIWAALIGLYPNAYVDFLCKLSVQQVSVLGERLIAFTIIYWHVNSADGTLVIWAIMLHLALLRGTFVLAQSLACVLIDARSISTVVMPEPLERPSVSGGNPLFVAAAQLVTSFGLYGGLLLYRLAAVPLDLAVVSFSLQAQSFASLLPIILLRLQSRTLASADMLSSSNGGVVIVAEAITLMKASLLPTFLSVVIVWGWLVLRYPSEFAWVQLLAAAIICAWAIAISFGIRFTRAILARGAAGFYLFWSLVYACTSIVASFVLGRELGPVGFAIGVVVPHLLVILRYRAFVVTPPRQGR
jgi:hypothetical protein